MVPIALDCFAIEVKVPRGMFRAGNKTLSGLIQNLKVPSDYTPFVPTAAELKL
ncbi:MAG: hypothetical protein AEth_01529 [Candidatus Argoarchaeum ethanivorans]|uniref:Uncharacterized protein n=1 Tax=Candidatus Argoarchaeum ethanivorans TaxID=2608793 RepID=A0A8B3RZ63_9EURY|nr:MAG: hypothetical protein AEth_01529 [Candidatus Argoarchaeum ethanivorans]